MYTLSNYFKNYDNTKYSKSLKKYIVNEGIRLKLQLSSNNNASIDLLNDIAIRIQKRINKGTLDQDSIDRYSREISKEANIQIDDVNKYIKTCIILSKHHSSQSTKINWLNFTNRTDSISHLINNEYCLVEKNELDELLAKIFLNASDVNARMKQEDYKAYHILKALKTESVVNEIANQFVELIRNKFNFQGFKDMVMVGLIQKNSEKKTYYPTVKLDELGLNDIEKLLNFLSDNNKDYIVKLSILWMLPSKFPSEYARLIDRIYTNNIQPTKNIKNNDQKLQLVTPCLDKIGNSNSIVDETLFKEAYFYPWYRDSDYIDIDESSLSVFTKNCIQYGIPYVSGGSGMANMYCKVMDILKIPSDSELGKEFMQAASAYIVASGMHSYYEVEYAFNLYIKKCHDMVCWPSIGLLENTTRDKPPSPVTLISNSNLEEVKPVLSF
ncbi:hypothetical protein L3V82_04285 [Thiotrichales bacterium 19S3-7]|nr:hypothetical protein [Thiotrichales bacterium 19S3-7]MCF6801312.1 hypothetical protein [Thiotrichales bacterium 19S3-11]